jgi:hypothetical protein
MHDLEAAARQNGLHNLQRQGQKKSQSYSYHENKSDNVTTHECSRSPAKSPTARSHETCLQRTSRF